VAGFKSSDLQELVVTCCKPDKGDFQLLDEVMSSGFQHLTRFYLYARGFHSIIHYMLPQVTKRGILDETPPGQQSEDTPGLRYLYSYLLIHECAVPRSGYSYRWGIGGMRRFK